MPREVAGAHPGLVREVLHRQRVLKAFQRPGHEVGEEIVPAMCHRGRNELSLSARAMRGHHQAACQRVGHRGTMVGPHEMQTEVQAGRLAGRGQDVTLVGVEHVRVDAYRWIPIMQQRRVRPMRGRAPAVEQTSLSEHESACAQRGHPGAAPMSRTDGIDQRLRWRLSSVATRRDNHCVGTSQCLQAMPDAGPEPAADLRVVLTTDDEVVPGAGQAPVDAEDLARRREFEQRCAVSDSQGNRGHVRNCTGYGVADTGPVRAPRTG